MAPRIIGAINDHQKALALMDAQTASRMVKLYGEAWKSISRDLAIVQAKIAAHQAAGKPVTVGWLYQVDQYNRMLDQVEAQLRRFSTKADKLIISQQKQAIQAALSHSHQLAASQANPTFEPFQNIPLQTAERAAALNTTGSPLQAIFDDMALLGRDAVDLVFTTGVLKGLNPNIIGLQVAARTGAALTRSLLVARTETMRVYREASRANYLANSHVVSSWRWVASCDSRSCAACWALHGRIFSLNEPQGTHPNCRCTLEPYIDGVTPNRESGIDRFNRAPLDVKSKVLSPSKLAAYQAGALNIGDLVHEKYTGTWGMTRTEKSLVGALGPNAAQYYK